MAMPRPSAARLLIASRQGFDLAVTQLRHGWGIDQLWFLFSHSPQHFHSSTRSSSALLIAVLFNNSGDISIRSAREHYQAGTLSNSFNRNISKSLECSAPRVTTFIFRGRPLS